MPNPHINWRVVLAILAGALSSWLAGHFAAGGTIGHFSWGVAAGIATAYGTTLLALSTWQDVRASRRVAEEAIEANRLVREERELRPDLTLIADDQKVQTQAEGPAVYVRLFVKNASGRRTALGSSVIVEGHTHGDGTPVTYGSAALGWSSAGSDDNRVVVFGGSSRVIDLGFVQREGVGGSSRWRLLLYFPALARAMGTVGRSPDSRNVVDTGTVVRVVVGADEGEAKTYDIGSTGIRKMRSHPKRS